MLSTYPLPVNDSLIPVDHISFEMGFSDGTKSALRGSMCNSESYLLGFRAGLKFYRCSIPKITEAPLELGPDGELLNEAYAP